MINYIVRLTFNKAASVFNSFVFRALHTHTYICMYAMIPNGKHSAIRKRASYSKTYIILEEWDLLSNVPRIAGLETCRKGLLYALN